MGQSLLNALFDSEADAQRAVERLAQIGVAAGDVKIISGPDIASSNDEGTGFWASLKNMFRPDEDGETFAEGIRRGAALVSLRPTDAKYDEAVDILDGEGAVDLKERKQSWLSERAPIPSEEMFAPTSGATSGAAVAGVPTIGWGAATAGMGAPTSLGSGVNFGPTGPADASRSMSGAIEKGAALRTEAQVVAPEAASPGAVEDAIAANSRK